MFKSSGTRRNISIWSIYFTGILGVFLILSNLINIANAYNPSVPHIYCLDVNNADLVGKLCLYSKSAINNNCVSRDVNNIRIVSGLSDDEKQEIVTEHNDYRQFVARGEESNNANGPLPAAKYMNDLVWDDELSVIAQKIADHCLQVFDVDFVKFCNNDGCSQLAVNHGTSTSTDLEQNFSMIKLIKKIEYDAYFFDVNNFNRVRSIVLSGYAYRYAKLINAKSEKIGCAATRTISNERFASSQSVFLYCVYSPGANVNELPYEAQL